MAAGRLSATIGGPDKGDAMSAAAPTPAVPARWTAGRVVLVVFGSLAALIGVALALGGAALMIGHLTQRDADGYLTSPHDRVAAGGYAVSAEGIDLANLDDFGRWLADHGLGRVRIRATNSTGTPLFVGIGRETRVDRYLAGVAHSELVDVRQGTDRYTVRAGGPPPMRPSRAGLWVASASGTGTQTLDWEAQSGRWAAVVMNADGSHAVAADVTVGAKLSALPWIAAALLLVGGLILAGGAAMIGVGVRGAGAPAPVTTPAPPDSAYPVQVDAEFDAGLSRGLWLVKWLLLIPHLMVLAFLWIAFLVLTVVALVAVVATGRYPRAIFDFNVGVLQWTWRVDYYGYSALGTDRYPPFTLGAADYPATLEIPYPERLSRGKSLVKWWLLALPHYFVLSIIAGNLNTLLVFFAAIVLLFTGRYPRDVFRLVVGINRWLFRVIAYAALMRDEYPPFRLDP